MTVRMGYVPRRSDASGAPKGTGTSGAILRAGTTFGKSGKKPRLFSNHVRTAKNPLFCAAVHINQRCTGQRTQYAVPYELSPNHEKSSGTAKTIGVPCEQGYTGGNSIGWPPMIKQRSAGIWACFPVNSLYHRANIKERNYQYA